MGVTHADVDTFLNSMQGLGESFARNRAERERIRSNKAQEAIRQQELDAQLERWKRATTHEERMEDAANAGSVEAYLQSDDGNGVIKFHGPQKGLDTLIQSAAQKGKKLTPMAEPPQKQPFAVIKTTTPIGDLEFHAQDPDQLGKITEQVQKMGGRSQNHTSSQYGPIAADQYATGLEDKADELEQQMQNGNMPGLDAQVKQSALVKGLRDRAKAIRSGIGRAEPPTTETVQTEMDPITGQPTTKTTRRGPVGTAPAAPGGLQSELNAARQAIQQGKDPEAVKARYKQRTGMDFPG